MGRTWHWTPPVWQVRHPKRGKAFRCEISSTTQRRNWFPTESIQIVLYWRTSQVALLISKNNFILGVTDYSVLKGGVWIWLRKVLPELALFITTAFDKRALGIQRNKVGKLVCGISTTILCSHIARRNWNCAPVLSEKRRRSVQNRNGTEERGILIHVFCFNNTQWVVCLHITNTKLVFSSQHPTLDRPGCVQLDLAEPKNSHRHHHL